MSYSTQQDILDFVEDNNVKFVRFAFCDIFGTQKNIAVLASNLSKALPTESEKAVAFHDNVLPVMDTLRAAADDAETICGEDYWPLPSYSKMLYYV